MRWQSKLLAAFIAQSCRVCRARSGSKVSDAAGSAGRHPCGRLFDARSGSLLTNQVILIKGDRITDVGASVQIRVARGYSTSLRPPFFRHDRRARPREHGGETAAERALIALANAQLDLDAGFTTILDMIREADSTRWIFALRSTPASSRDRGCRLSVNRSIQEPAIIIPMTNRYGFSRDSQRTKH